MPTRAHLGCLPAAGVTRVSFGLQSTHAHVLVGLGRRHVPDAAETIAAAVAGGRLQHLEPRPHLRGRRRRATTTGPAPSSDVLGLDNPPPHVSAYALTVEPGTPLAPDAAAIPTTTCRPGATSGPTPCWPPPATAGRRSPTGPGPATSAGTTASTGTRATTWASARPPTPTATGVRWWNVRTPERYLAAVEAGRSAEARAGGAHRRPARLRAPGPGAAHPARRALGGPRAARGLDGLVVRVRAEGRDVVERGGGTGRCSPWPAGCWPTRSAPESAPVSCSDDRDGRGNGAAGRPLRRSDGEGGAPVPGAGASSSRRPRSTAASAPPTTTARSGSTCCAT